jgi:hypothetical protein
MFLPIVSTRRLHRLGSPRNPGAEPRADLRSDRELFVDLRTVSRFVHFYCRRRHAERPRDRFELKAVDVDAVVGSPVSLCAECRRLLAHAMTKRLACPMSPKPACKHCPKHCYHPAYRQRIRKIMRYSGTRMLLTGRLDYLLHVLF